MSRILHDGHHENNWFTNVSADNHAIVPNAFEGIAGIEHSGFERSDYVCTAWKDALWSSTTAVLIRLHHSLWYGSSYCHSSGAQFDLVNGSKIDKKSL